jgi:hypothetical protein
MIRQYCFYVLFVLVALSGELRAQGVWKTQELCDCTPESLVYDKLIKGFAVTHFHKGPPTYRSAGRGSVWKETTPGLWRSISDTATTNGANRGESFGAISQERLVFVNGENVNVSEDSGKTWLVGSIGPTSILIHFFSGDSGYKVIPDYYDSSFVVRLTYGSTVFFLEEVMSRQLQSRKDLPHSAIAWGADTLILLSSAMVMITTDRGADWKDIPLFADRPNLKKPFSFILSKTSDPRFFFLVQAGDYGVDDYMFTTDFGTSWTYRKPRFGGRLARLVATNRMKWFGLVGDSLYDVASGGLFYRFFDLYHPSRGDTLVYTTDAGLTWQTEQRFVGDTITHLVAGDSGRVYMMHFRGGKTYISTYFPDGQESVEYIKARHSTLKVYPNPSTSSLNFTLPVSTNLHVKFVNVLGQVLYETRVDHHSDHPSTIQYPAQLQDWRGPLLMLVEADWFKINQLIIKQ